MLLSHQLVLVAVDAEGRFIERRASLSAGLAGGLLMELALSGCIDASGGLLAIRRGSFAEPIVEEMARRLASRPPEAPALVVADVEGRGDAIRDVVLGRMESLGMGVRRRGGLREALQESTEAGEFVLPNDDGVRFVPSSPETGVALRDSLAAGAQSLTMSGDTAPLLALSLASGVWRPQRQMTPMRFEDSLLRGSLDCIPRIVRASAEAVIQGVAARTLAWRVRRSARRGLGGIS